MGNKRIFRINKIYKVSKLCINKVLLKKLLFKWSIFVALLFVFSIISEPVAMAAESTGSTLKEGRPIEFYINSNGWSTSQGYTNDVRLLPEGTVLKRNNGYYTRTGDNGASNMTVTLDNNQDVWVSGKNNDPRVSASPLPMSAPGYNDYLNIPVNYNLSYVIGFRKMAYNEEPVGFTPIIWYGDRYQPLYSTPLGRKFKDVYATTYGIVTLETNGLACVHGYLSTALRNFGNYYPQYSGASSLKDKVKKLVCYGDSVLMLGEDDYIYGCGDASTGILGLIRGAYNRSTWFGAEKWYDLHKLSGLPKIKDFFITTTRSDKNSGYYIGPTVYAIDFNDNVWVWGTVTDPMGVYPNEPVYYATSWPADYKNDLLTIPAIIPGLIGENVRDIVYGEVWALQNTDQEWNENYIKPEYGLKILKNDGTVYFYRNGVTRKLIYDYTYKVESKYEIVNGVYKYLYKLVMTSSIDISKNVVAIGAQGYAFNDGRIVTIDSSHEKLSTVDGAPFNWINGVYDITMTAPTQNDTLSDLTNCIPSMTVSDSEGHTLTCKYYIDSVEKETKTISNTATAQVVKFSALDVRALSEGAHTFKFEVSDGKGSPISQTVTVMVDKSPPVLKNVSFTSEDTSITISGTATDSLSGMDSTGYRYTVGNNASDWVSDTSRKISSLLPNTLYNAKFEAKDKAGHIAKAEKNIYTKAQIPQIDINNIKENSMDLNINDSNPLTTQYQVMAGSGYVTATGDITSSPVWITSANKKITVNGLSPNTQYSIKAKAKNSEGQETTFSAQIIGTTLSQPPNNIKLAPEINSIKISWEAVKGASGYDVEADSKISDAGATIEYIHSGLQAETTHTYRVRTRNAGGAGIWSGYISGTTLPNPPEMPVITETATTQSAITITWDAVAKADGYEIEADGKIIDTNQETSYTDEGLKPDSLHKYRVRAKNAGGASEWSTVMEVSTLPLPPEIPENLKAMPTRNTITLTWEKAARSGGYEIEADGVIYSLESASYIHEDLSANSIHSYRVRALNRGGKSGWSELVKVTTWPEIPSTPSNIMATAETGTISLTWYSSPFAESYDIQIDGGNIVNVKSTLFSNESLEPGTKHTYKIRAKNISGDGEWSKLLEISTLPIENIAPEEKAIIANIAAVVTNKTVTIAWQAVAANSQYEIEIDGVVSDNGKDTIYNHTGLEPVSFHTYRIRTKDADGKGEWCAVLALSTLPDPPDAPAGINAIASDTQIELSWTREEGTGYEVEVDGEVVDAGEADRYTDSGLNSGTTHTYRVRGKNISGVTAWSDSITKSTTSPSYEVECKNGVEFNFTLLAANVQDFGDMTFVVTYNPEELEVEDLCEYTGSREKASGSIAGTNLKVKTEEGRLEFRVNESIAAGTTWSGEITTIVFKPRIDGKVSINFTVE